MPRYEIRVLLRRRRLVLYDRGRPVKSYPVGVGKLATQTPHGNFVIVSKVPYPFSHPGGRLSPFGTLWMGLSRPHYGIHGTNNPSSIGKYVSHGCIRMYNRDVEELARIVPLGTPVKIRP